MKYLKTLFLEIILLLCSVIAAQAQCTYVRPVAPTYAGSVTDLNTEVTTIYNRLSDIYLNQDPTSSQLNDAIAEYNALNILANTSNNTIVGNNLADYSEVAFVRVFANYLKFNPNASNYDTIAFYARNTIWHTTLQALPQDIPSGYKFRDYGIATVFLKDLLAPTIYAFSPVIVDSFKAELDFNAYYLYNMFWVPDGSYDDAYQETCTAINSDIIYNYANILLAFAKWQDTPADLYQYMSAYQRWLNRFLTYSTGTNDSFKPDGTGFHHWAPYERYMYAYNTVSYVLDALGSGNSQFQVSVEAYKLFRDAVFYRIIVANDDDVVSITLSGRSGKRLKTTLSQYAFRSLAIAGGNILGLPIADTLLAGIYKRKYGNYGPFNSISTSPFEEGFFQFNYAMGGVFRKNGYVVTARGFTNNVWGSEIFPTENRYGRYQSYGVLDIVYPGDITEVNGNEINGGGWDWRYNPGTTTKVLDWNKLVASTGRIDEQQNNRFTGALAFKNKESNLLTKIWGTYGLFGMDFKEKMGGGFQGTFGVDTHDSTFTFKKSNFFFDDLIISLGSNINNADTSCKTVTTLYQRIVPNPSFVTVNNSNFTAIGSQDYTNINSNWLIDNSGTGFYVETNSGNLNVQRDDISTPKESGGNFNPTTTSTNHFVTKHVAIGYLDHGLAPVNKEYEFVVIPGLHELYPNQNDANQYMINLANSFQNPLTKPYTILQKDSNAHIISHKATGIYGYSLFKSNENLLNTGNVIANDYPCLIMYQPNNENTQMKFAISNPDVGIAASRSYLKTQEKIINIKLDGKWSLVNPHSAIALASQDSISTTFAFTTLDGLPIEADFFKNSASLNENNKDLSEIILYPNPAENYFRLKGVKIGETVTVISSTGKVISQIIVESEEQIFSTLNLQKGVYFVSIEGRNVLKLIKFK